MSVQPLSLSQIEALLGIPGATVTLTGSELAAGYSTSSLAHFAGSETDPFLILSTGVASEVTMANSSGSQGTDLGPAGVEGDRLTLHVTVPKPEGARAFSFEFTFMSDEYPEYVGSAYNDYLSVKINGVEAAIDTNGNEISVNNNFFTSEYSPTGTFFDGQTPPLKVTAPITGDGDTVDITIEIADRGDGIYDSAAFLKGFTFVKPQVVYLQFDQGYIEFPSADGTHAGFILPTSGLTEAQQDAIVAAVNDIYDGFLIEFTRTQPTSGSYSTVHVGGVASDLPTWFGASAGLRGQAEHIDFGNADKADSAFVLSGYYTQGTNTPDLAAISQVIAHEAGHILGLRHVVGPDELMYPFANATSTTIGGEQSLGQIVDGEVKPILFGLFTQNSHEELERNLGLENDSKLTVTQSFFDKITKFFGIDLDSTASTIHDVKIVVITEEGEVISVQNVGDVTGDGAIELLVPAVDTDRVVLIGKSTADGGYDTFVAPPGVTNFNLGAASQSNVFDTLGVSVADIGTESFGIFKSDAFGNLTSLGSLHAVVVDAGNVAATDGDDLLTGTDLGEALLGLGGNDTLAGLAGNDTLFGNTGDDNLDGGDGDDLIDGGAGTDTASYVKASAGVAVDLSLSGDQDTVGAGKDKLSGIEALVGSAFADTLTGGAGDDTIEGGFGDDSLTGGAGTDTVSFANAGNGAMVSLAITTAQETGTGLDTITGFENVLGSDANDTLTGDAAANILSGAGGNDSLAGGDGDDTLQGGLGDDVLDGGFGLDTASYARATAGVAVNLGVVELQDTGVTGFDTLISIERLLGSNYADTLTGGAGDDTIEGGLGDDVLAGGDGIDTLSYRGATFGVTVSLALADAQTTGAGLDTVSGFENLVGSAFADTLAGSDAANLIDGGAGDDQMTGGLGDDRYLVDSTGDTVIEAAGGGNDTVTATVSYTLGAEIETLVLSGDAAITGTGNAIANQIFGTAAANTLDGSEGADTMVGGLGDDVYFVDNSADVVLEADGAGTDIVNATASFSLVGQAIEVLNLLDGATNGTGNSLANTITGNAAANRLDGGAGADLLTGGLGNDTYVVDESGDLIVETAGGGTDTVESAISYALGAELENLVLTGSGATKAIGNGLANVLTGNSGANAIDGKTGADTMSGGKGNDTYYVDNAGDRVIEKSGGGTDTVFATVSFSLVGQDIEKLQLNGSKAINATGNSLKNTLTGNSGANILDGKTGADTMSGGKGNDTYYVDNSGDRVVEKAKGGNDTVHSTVTFSLSGKSIETLDLDGRKAINGSGNNAANTILGNDGNNKLSGNGGNDVLRGGAGKDILDGGSGKDLLKGGAGADTFVFEKGDTGKTRATADRIADFSHAQHDRIDLSKIDAITSTKGNQAFTFIGSTAFSGTAGELRTFRADGHLYVAGDTNGDMSSDFVIRVDGTKTLVAADFVL